MYEEKTVLPETKRLFYNGISTALERSTSHRACLQAAGNSPKPRALPE
jgi:hypothetical protein